MSSEAIESEIEWQIQTRLIDAELNPRMLAYRVLTVLRAEMTLELISSTESNIVRLSGVGSNSNDEDFDHSEYRDPILSYYGVTAVTALPSRKRTGYMYASVPMPGQLPPTTEELEEISVMNPDPEA